MDFLRPSEPDAFIARPFGAARSRSRFTSQCPRDRAYHIHVATIPAVDKTSTTPLSSSSSLSRTLCPVLVRQEAFYDHATRSPVVHRAPMMLPSRCGASSATLVRRRSDFENDTDRAAKRMRTNPSAAAAASSATSTVVAARWSGRASMAGPAGLGIYLATPEPSDTEPSDTEDDDEYDSDGADALNAIITPASSFGADASVSKPASGTAGEYCSRRPSAAFAPPALHRSDGSSRGRGGA